LALASSMNWLVFCTNPAVVKVSFSRAASKDYVEVGLGCCGKRWLKWWSLERLIGWTESCSSNYGFLPTHD
ncbi:hypothetical protein PIB30_115367, partial [Stylosanthes scabra]|nr:hypothetical protein [Stylosanthes scabra]